MIFQQKNEKEHPGYIIGKKEKFRIIYYKPQKYEEKNMQTFCRYKV